MRNIEFRAWDREEERIIPFKELVYRSVVMDFLPEYIDVFNEVNGRYNTQRVYMQYSGVKDSEGTKIYEGDIIEYKTVYEWDKKPTKRAVVVFENGVFSPAGVLMDLSRSKVIGNVFENNGLIDNMSIEQFLSEYRTKESLEIDYEYESNPF